MNPNASTGSPEPEDAPFNGGVDAGDAWQARLLSIEQEFRKAGPGGEAGTDLESWSDPCPADASRMPPLQLIDRRYKPVAFLGEGAASWVFKGVDTLLQRPVALKLLKAGAAKPLREARAQARVDHPNVCGIHEVGPGYLVLQWMNGGTLGRVGPGLPLLEKVRIVQEAAMGVDAAHTLGLIHLDLKLDNLLMYLDAEGVCHPAIGDFGMVLLDGEDPGRPCPKGTPPYASPEQLQGDINKIDRRSDVYSLGVILYLLLTGNLPWDAGSVPSLLVAMAGTDPVPVKARNPAIPADLAAITHRCLAKRPDGRYPSAASLAEDLARFRRGQAVQAMGGAPGYRMRKWAGRNRRVIWMGAAALCVTFGVSAFLASRLAFASLQAEWDHGFQKRVQDIQSCLDHAYRLPRQNIEGEILKARRMAADLEREVSVQGRAAQGPGHLALGQVRLLVDRDNLEAEREIEIAWNLGYRTKGAKVWQAFALVQRFRREAGSVLGDPASRPNGKTLKGLDSNYLAPAREFLSWQRTSEEVLLARLVKTAPFLPRKPQDFDPLIRALRDYRQANPAEIYAWIEEAKCMGLKAGFLAAEDLEAKLEVPGHTVAPGTETSATVNLEVRALLKRSLEVAPSCPQIYNLLSICCTSLSEDAHTEPANRPGFRKEARQWAELGLSVSPTDKDLLGQKYLMLANQLKTGGKAGPIEAAWRASAAQAWQARNEGAYSAALFGAFEVAEARWGKGESGLGLLNEALDRLERFPAWFPRSQALADNLAWFKAEAGDAFTQCGLDPGRLDAIRERLGGQSLEGPDAALRCRASIVEAEHALLTGGNAQDAWRNGLAQLARIPPAAPLRSELELHLDLLQAWIFDTEDAWRALGTRLEGRIGPAASPRLTWLLLRARLSRACRERIQGRRLDALLTETRSIVGQDARTRSPLPPSLGRETRALACLLDGGEGSLGIGLEEIRSAQEYGRAGSGKDQGVVVRPIWVPPPHRGRSLAIEGELHLALARQEKDPHRRLLHLGRAREAFRRALVANPNLRNRIGPRMEVLARDQGTLPEPSGRLMNDYLHLFL